MLLVLCMGTGLLLLAPAGRMGDRFGRRRTYALCLGVVAVLLLAVPFCHTLWALALDFIGIGIGYAFVLPAWNSILLRLLPADIRGSGLGIMMTVEGMGGVIGPLVGGLLLVASGASVQWRSEAVD